MKVLSLALIAGLSTYALAREPRREHRPPGPPPGCEDMKLTDAQRAQMRDLHLKFEDERIDMEAQARHARVAFRKLISAKDADPKVIRTAAQAAAEADAKLRVADEMQKTEVLLSVFKPEQREDAARCARGFGPRPPPPHGPHHGEPGPEDVD